MAPGSARGVRDKSGLGHLSLETMCVTLAKGKIPRGEKVVGEDGGQLGAAARKSRHVRLTTKDFINRVAQFSAVDGQVEKSERWLHKLDGERQCGPEVTAFNDFIHAAARKGNLPKAQEWFTKLEEIALHPELTGLQKNLQSYDIIIQAFSEAGELATAEKYAREAESLLGQRPSLASQCALVRAAIAKGEPIRASNWMETLVRRGCGLRENYQASMVKLERRATRPRRTWDVHTYVTLVIALVEALANNGNAILANQWLAYLSECGLHYDEAPELWERVRSATPNEIVPSGLSCEGLALPSPSYKRPALLVGESWGDALALAPSPLSPAIPSRPNTSQGLVNGGRLSQLSDRSSPARAASPALRKMLDARTRGATPTLHGIGSATGRISR